MKVVEIERILDGAEITVEHGFWIFKKNITYRTVGKIVGICYIWVRTSDMQLITGTMSFQLDIWKEVWESETRPRWHGVLPK